ncbi:MAG: hypothetical protein A4E57_01363 [Syntrophorhabdaceae bacterium PtaU1.Bin034]|jgi:hypothetical protein|nr:MAG: hypothetical protein A4E57_01363 [Syntrophorhabdaceae bacterium PtaU1.Bin034]
MLRKYLCCYLIFAMFVIGIAPRVEAAFTPSVSLTPADRAGDLEKIRTVLQHKLVVQRLHDLGFSADEISARLSQLNDQQIHSFAQQLDDLKVGQVDAIWWLVIAIVIVLIVFVLLPMVGVRIFG